MMSSRLLPVLLLLLVVSVGCVPVQEEQSAKKRAQYHYILGVSALNEQNSTGALKEFLEAEKLDKRDHQIQAGLGQAYWLKQAHSQAEQHFQNAIKLSNGDPRYYNNLGALYLTMERFEDSIKAFTVAADNLLFDRPEVAWTGIGYAYVQLQDYQAAHRAYKKAIELNPRYYMSPFRLGELYYNQDRPVEALEAFNRAVELAPGFAQGFYWQGLVHMKLKDTVQAKNSFKEVVRLAPQSDTARLANNYLKILK